MAVTMFSNPSEYLLSWNIIFIKIFADAINESNPRVIDDSRARKLANDLKRCAYYETCATYGLNVERVFQDGKQSEGAELRAVCWTELFSACQKICIGRGGSSRPTTPNHFVPRPYPGYVASPTNTNGYTNTAMVTAGPPHSPGSSGYHQGASPAHLPPHQNTFGKVSNGTVHCLSVWVSSRKWEGHFTNFTNWSDFEGILVLNWAERVTGEFLDCTDVSFRFWIIQQWNYHSVLSLCEEHTQSWCCCNWFFLSAN